MEFLEREESEFLEIFYKLKKRDFSGNKGQAIKNSTFQISASLAAKIGSIFFTIIIARLLLPELFGLYSLTLSTIVLFSSFSDFGLTTALINFVSKSIGIKKFSKAKSYFKIILKYKIILVLIASLILLASAYFISKNYYNKPIFLGLLAGGLYLPIVSLIGFLDSLFKSNNDFKTPFLREIIFQGLRFILVPLGILLFLKYSFSQESLIAGIIIILAVSYFISAIFLLIFYKTKLSFLKSRKEGLNKGEKKELKKFTIPLIATALSGIFFGYIDTIMLGHYVSSEFIGYYSAAFSLIGSASAIIGFSSASVFPIFARLKGKILNKALSKTLNLTLFLSFLGAFIAFFGAGIIVNIIYGSQYSPAVNLLKLFAALLFVLPLSGIYDSYFISQGKTKFIAGLLLFTTILNIILNYFFINYGLKFGMMQAVFGAAIATIISRIVYLAGEMIFRNFLFRK